MGHDNVLYHNRR